MANTRLQLPPGAVPVGRGGVLDVHLRLKNIHLTPNPFSGIHLMMSITKDSFHEQMLVDPEPKSGPYLKMDLKLFDCERFAFECACMDEGRGAALLALCRSDCVPPAARRVGGAPERHGSKASARLKCHWKRMGFRRRRCYQKGNACTDHIRRTSQDQDRRSPRRLRWMVTRYAHRGIAILQD